MRVKTVLVAAVMLAGTAALAPSAAFAAGPPKPAPGTHLMMDAASAPSLSTMAAWQKASPYSAIGVYIPVSSGVDNRYDKTQSNLTASWVSTVRARGWNVLPIYVGRQAPNKCTSRTFHYVSGNITTAAAQARSAASDAAASAARLGIPASAPIMYDMEAYTPGCKPNVMRAYYDAWTRQLHALGRMSGIYGSRDSTITDVASMASHGKLGPDVVWAATATGKAQTASMPPLANGTWSGKRMNQFNLGVTRKYGGTAINIDESAVDDYVWDTTAPRLTVPAVAQAISGKKATVSWSASDPGGSGVARYQFRTKRAGFGKKMGHWGKVKNATSTARHAKLKLGDQWCLQVRAFDHAGNVSGWSAARCTTRYADDRRLTPSKGKGLKRAHVKSAFRHTTTVGRHKNRTLSTGKVHARSIGVVLHGTGTVNVLIGHHQVGRVSGSGLLWVHLPKVRHGKVRIQTVSRKKVAVDAIALSQF